MLLSLSFILPEKQNFTPAELMHKRAKELPGQYTELQGKYCTTFIMYQGKLFVYDHYVITKMSNSKQHINLVLKEV